MFVSTGRTRRRRRRTRGETRNIGGGGDCCAPLGASAKKNAPQAARAAGSRRPPARSARWTCGVVFKSAGWWWVRWEGNLSNSGGARGTDGASRQPRPTPTMTACAPFPPTLSLALSISISPERAAGLLHHIGCVVWFLCVRGCVVGGGGAFIGCGGGSARRELSGCALPTSRTHPPAGRCPGSTSRPNCSFV